MSIRRYRRVFAVGMTLVGAALLSAGPVSANGTGGSPAGSGVRTTTTAKSADGATGGGLGDASAPTAITLCRGYGSYLGLGVHRVAAGKNLLVVEVCGDAAKHTVSMVRDSYIKVDGPQAGNLRFHWRWADKSGAVKGGGDDNNAAFALSAQSENTFAWPYSKPVAPIAPASRCVVGVLTEGTTQFLTEPVCM